MFISDGPQIMQSMILIIVSEHFHAIIVVISRTVIYHKYGYLSCIMMKNIKDSLLEYKQSAYTVDDKLSWTWTWN